jgi:hypothetical protein
MIALITFVLQFSPWQKLYSGCSESSKRGVIHVTGGSASCRMSRTTPSTENMCRSHRRGCSRYRRIAEYADQMYPFWTSVAA